MLGEQCHIFVFFSRLDSGHIFHFIFLCNKGLSSEFFIFYLYSNWLGGGYLDLIDFQRQILMHRQIYCAYISLRQAIFRVGWGTFVTGHIVQQ